MTYEQIHNLFKQRYNQNNWKQFLGEAFANARLLTTPEILTGIDSNIASQVQKLGYITLNENGIERQIAVYEVTLAQGIILERNRVGLRNLLRKYWKDIDAAFIAYHRPDDSTGSSAKWRFTYVSELTGYDADGEFVKIKTEPKRYTYVLGEGESTRTAAERFTAIANKGSKATLDDVKEAFSVEKLSKTFFDEYKKHYTIFCDFVINSKQARSCFTDYTTDKEKDIRDFNKKLLGRIVFLYFIQKKGWLGVPAKSDWGKGDFNFLTQQFENFRNKDFFYKDFLSVLFFETLNVDRKKNDDLIELVKGEPCRIPYLNGGLFEEDDKKHRNLIFPANLFKNLFDFFNQYNFTIYEDDPNDHTVAVDPEMLGHIFENLLEDNKDKGAYYTPKEIVHYMCQESLIEYLTTHCLNPDLHDLGINMMDEELKETIGLFIKKKAFDLDALKKSSKSNESYKSWFRQLNDALDNVKICDPAIGSGAFPMGLLHEIFTAKQTLHTFEHGNTKTFDASAVKLNIIQNSIYGVDIEKGAVDIARLRFWLSLIVDEERPKALPNLDYKIVVGNSLVSKLGDDIIDIDWDIKESVGKADEYVQKLKKVLAELTKKQKDYFESDDKSQLKSEIRNLKLEILINQLSFNKERYANSNNLKTDLGFGLKPAEVKKNLDIKLQLAGFDKTLKDLQILKNEPEIPLHFFDWKLDFPEVMNEQITSKVGFDIVIGNPPYVEAKKLKHISQFLKGYKVYSGTSDLSSYFFEQGLRLCKTSGLLSLINTNKFFNTGYGKPLRALIIQNEIKQLLNFEQVEVFEGILVSSVIISIKKKSPNSINVFPFKKFFKMKNIEFMEKFVEEINNREKYNQNDLSEAEWSFADSSNLLLKEKIENNATKLINLKGVSIYRGITTGFNPAFIINDQQKDELIKMDKKNKDVIKSLLQGRNIRKWVYNESDENLLFIPWHFPLHNDNTINGNSTKAESALKNDYPKLYEHLCEFREELSSRNKEETGIRYEWYALQRCAASYYTEFEKQEKIIWGLTADKWAYAYDDKQHYLPSNGYILVSDKTPVKYLLGLINSNLLKYYFGFIGVMTAGGAFTLKHATIQQLPIRLAKNQNLFIEKVNKILSFKSEGKDTTALEQEIDNLVYKLYELTYDEVKVIDPAFRLSKEEYEAIKLE